MDFFGHQERARRASGRLVLLFVLALVGIALCIHLAATLLLLATDAGSGGLFRPEALLVTVLATVAVVGGGALFKTAQLRQGGSKVATLLGGTPVPLETSDPKERMLRNLVEEMAIASGVPVPEIFVLDGEQGINAFAAGWSTADAAVAVTRGCLEQLDRDELQGVIAHEFSHVFHGDMRLNIRLMSVLFGIVCITTIGRIVVESVGRGAVRSSNSKGKGGAAGLVLFGVALIVIGWLGVLFARLIQAAVSRQREYLADASAVQYTRNPRGIGLALAKIGGLGSRLQSAHAEEASHMLFADGMKRFLGNSMATHPPIEERIERVLPGFRRQMVSSGTMVAAAGTVPLPPGMAAAAMGAAGFGATGGAAAGTAPPQRIQARELFESVGDPQQVHVQAARDLLAALPLELAVATHDPARAQALVLALLLDPDHEQRLVQTAPLQTRDAALAHEALVLFRLVAALPGDQRLPLLELAIPALRRLPPSVRQQLRADARALAMADGQLHPFEWALLQTMERHVRLPDERPRRPTGRPSPLVAHPREVSVVLSTIAHTGAAGDPAGAAAAFACGHATLGKELPFRLLAASECRITDLEKATDALASVSPIGKRNLLTACLACASDDGTLTPEEADLLRALAGLWDCPVPLAPKVPV